MSFDPTVGRWLTLDPIGFQASDANLYRYAGNDPTNATDPSGLQVGANAMANSSERPPITSPLTLSPDRQAALPGELQDAQKKGIDSTLVKKPKDLVDKIEVGNEFKWVVMPNGSIRIIKILGPDGKTDKSAVHTVASGGSSTILAGGAGRVVSKTKIELDPITIHYKGQRRLNRDMYGIPAFKKIGFQVDPVTKIPLP